MTPEPTYHAVVTGRVARVNGRHYNSGNAIPCANALAAYGLHEAYKCSIYADGRELTAEEVKALGERIRAASAKREADRERVPAPPEARLEPPLALRLNEEPPPLSAGVEELRAFFASYYGDHEAIRRAEHPVLRWAMKWYFRLPAGSAWRKVPEPVEGVPEVWLTPAMVNAMAPPPAVPPVLHQMPPPPEEEPLPAAAAEAPPAAEAVAAEEEEEDTADEGPVEPPMDGPEGPAAVEVELLQLREGDSFPPSSGPGSSKNAIRAFLKSYGVEAPEGASRDELLHEVSTRFQPPAG